MNGLFTTIGRAISERWILWVAVAVAFVLAYNLMLMLALIVRFGDLPNYTTFYDYFGNVARIVESTPSIADMIPIIREEWLIEIGHMNYEYGNGISEWSLTILPEKLLILIAVGSLIATVVVLLMPGKDGACAAVSKKAAVGAAGGGAALVGLSSATLSWVVCCAAPTWVVSLAMLGMGVSLAFWLEPLGTFITVSGFVLLAATVLFLAHRRLHGDPEDGSGRSVSHSGMSAVSS
jgi:hypothetical protein